MANTTYAGPSLREIRESKALTLRETGLDPSVLCAIENGRKPQPKTIRRLAKLYKLTPAEVVAAWKAGAA